MKSTKQYAEKAIRNDLIACAYSPTQFLNSTKALGAAAQSDAQAADGKGCGPLTQAIANSCSDAVSGMNLTGFNANLVKGYCKGILCGVMKKAEKAAAEEGAESFTCEEAEEEEEEKEEKKEETPLHELIPHGLLDSEF